MRSTLTLDFAGVRVRVESTNLAALTWLREFLGPSFGDTSGEGPDHAVLVTHDPGEFELLQARGPHASERLVSCFALDTRMIALPAWDADGEVTLVFDRELEVFYRQTRPVSGRAVPTTEILWHSAERAMRVALLRVVREIVSARIVGQGGLLVHGAAFAAHGAGYIVAGPKQAGKTTVLLHMLRAGGASYLSNDRVLMTRVDGTATVRGIPTIVAIRPSSLAMFPGFGDSVTTSGYHHSLTIDEAKQLRKGNEVKELNPPDLSPAQLCDLLQAPRLSEAPASAVIFPRQTGRPTGVQLEPLSHSDASARLRASLFRANDPVQFGDLFGQGHKGSSRERLCDETAASISCFECRLGTDAYEGRESAERMLSVLESTRYSPPSVVRTTSRSRQSRSKSPSPGI